MRHADLRRASAAALLSLAAAAAVTHPAATGNDLIGAVAAEVAGTGVTVNSVLPGPTASEGATAFVAELAASQGVDIATVEREFFKSARPFSVIRRFSSPAEVGAMIAYVCSAQASSTTGAALRVDGGVLRSIV